MKLLVINGPNLNFLGIREPEIYGSDDYQKLLQMIGEKGTQVGVPIDVFQSNCEGELIDRIQQAYLERVDGIVINAGAYTHYSYAIRDALRSLSCPIIEVHISNIYQREEFRKTTVIGPVCTGQIAGLGLQGYLLAIDALLLMEGRKKP